MSWNCKLINIVGTKLVEYNPPKNTYIVGETVLVDDLDNEYSLGDLPIGSMFYLPKNADMTEWPWYLAKESNLSDNYYSINKHRQPLFVLLPRRTLFVIDGKCWSNGKKYGGWSVTGDAPNITVQPSINIQGTYHGWLQNGVISEDCEGRVY